MKWVDVNHENLSKIELKDNKLNRILPYMEHLYVVDNEGYFRGFHGSTESTNTLMKGFAIYYNFIRKHQAINKTPSELATDIKLNENKWLDLINSSSKD